MRMSAGTEKRDASTPLSARKPDARPAALALAVSVAKHSSTKRATSFRERQGILAERSVEFGLCQSMRRTRSALAISRSGPRRDAPRLRRRSGTSRQDMATQRFLADEDMS